MVTLISQIPSSPPYPQQINVVDPCGLRTRYSLCLKTSKRDEALIKRESLYAQYGTTDVEIVKRGRHHLVYAPKEIVTMAKKPQKKGSKKKPQKKTDPRTPEMMRGIDLQNVGPGMKLKKIYKN